MAANALDTSLNHYQEWQVSQQKPQTSSEECVLLSELGLPTNVRTMGLGHLHYLQTFLSSHRTFSRETLEVLDQRGYDWRREHALKALASVDALYLDTVVRLNEISTQLEELSAPHRAAIAEEREIKNLVRRGLNGH